MAAHPVDRLRAGMRVVVRYRIADAAASASDVLGDLLWIDHARLAVLTRREVAVIDRADVLAAKPVPMPTGRAAAARLSPAQLQYVALGGWPPIEAQWLGGWLLRSSGGYTRRANSVLPLADSLEHLDVLGPQVDAWYAARGEPTIYTVLSPAGSDPAQAPLATALAARGLGARSRTLVLTAQRADLPRPIPSRPVRVEAELSDRWLRAAGPGIGGAPQAARAVLTGSPDQVFLSTTSRSTASGDGTTGAEGDTGGPTECGAVGVARVAFSRGWAGLFGVWVAPAARGRGHAGALLDAALEQVALRGVGHVYLQVEHDNQLARTMYERRGFATHHGYAYLQRP